MQFSRFCFGLALVSFLQAYFEYLSEIGDLFHRVSAAIQNEKRINVSISPSKKEEETDAIWGFETNLKSGDKILHIFCAKICAIFLILVLGIAAAEEDK